MASRPRIAVYQQGHAGEAVEPFLIVPVAVQDRYTTRPTLPSCKRSWRDLSVQLKAGLESDLTSQTWCELSNDHKQHDLPSRLRTPGSHLEFASEASPQGYRMHNDIHRS
jgi:hypothetical protein